MIRFLKQFGYGIFYLAAFAALIGLVYLVFLRPNPPPPPIEDSSTPEIPAPTFSFDGIKTEVAGEEIRVTGILVNESPQIVPAVRVKAIIFDKNGFEIFSSETLQENIRAYDRKEFTVFFPQDRDLARQIGTEFTEASYVLEE